MEAIQMQWEANQMQRETIQANKEKIQMLQNELKQLQLTTCNMSIEFLGPPNSQGNQVNPPAVVDPQDMTAYFVKSVDVSLLQSQDIVELEILDALPSSEGYHEMSYQDIMQCKVRFVGVESTPELGSLSERNLVSSFTKLFHEDDPTVMACISLAFRYREETLIDVVGHFHLTSLDQCLQVFEMSASDLPDPIVVQHTERYDIEHCMVSIRSWQDLERRVGHPISLRIGTINVSGLPVDHITRKFLLD